MNNKIIVIGIACIISVKVFSQNNSYDCDTIYKVSRFVREAKFNDGIPSIYEYMGKELYCRPEGDSIYFKIVTFLIDKKGHPYIKKIIGYQSECESNIRKMVEKMPPWSPALKKKEPVCYEEEIPVIIKRNK